MRTNMFFSAVACLSILTSVMCSSSNTSGNKTNETPVTAAVPMPGGDNPTRPNMDTRNTTTETMKKANANKTQNGVIVDGCRESATVAKGESLQILLPATAGTGYVWTMAKASAIITRNGTEVNYQDEANTDPNMVGRSQKQVLDFVASEAGTETIDLIYSRSFEKNKIEKKCTITITVK